MLKTTNKAHPVDIAVGQRIRLQREILSMSQTALGQAVGVSFQQIQKYEKGLNRVGASRLDRIAVALDIPVAALFGNLGSPVNHQTTDAFTLESVIDFLATDEGRKLNLAFTRIHSLDVRRKLVDLATSLANVQ